MMCNKTSVLIAILFISNVFGFVPHCVFDHECGPFKKCCSITQDAREPPVKQCAVTCPGTPRERLDPPGRPCESTWDCKWWKLEICTWTNKGEILPDGVKPEDFFVYYCKPRDCPKFPCISWKDLMLYAYTNNENKGYLKLKWLEENKRITLQFSDRPRKSFFIIEFSGHTFCT